MGIEITDTWHEILKAFPDGRFDLGKWKEYAEKTASGLSEFILADSREYDFEKEILPVLHDLFEHLREAERAHQSFVSATNRLAERLKYEMQADLDCQVIFYLGLCNGAGWATMFQKKQVVLLGIEKIVELGWTDEKSMAALIYHELGHIWHTQNRNLQTKLHTPKEQALWQLYTEGMAMYFEQLMCEDINFYHQDRNGWLSWCVRNRTHIAREWIRKIDSDADVNDFFGDWNSFEGYSDTGYYLGAEVIHILSEKKSLKELANVELNEFEQHLRREFEVEK